MDTVTYDDASLQGMIRRVLISGIATIDDDHLVFAVLAAELQQAIERGDRAAVQTAARALEPHGPAHFVAEERLLVEYGYCNYDPEAFEGHVAEHARIGVELTAILAKPDLTIADAVEIKALLVEHLLRWDVRYLSYIQGLGLRR